MRTRTAHYMMKQHFQQIEKIEKKQGWKFNRGIKSAVVAKMDATLRFPIVFSMLHGPCDDEVRVMVVMDEKPSLVLVDMPLELFNALPTVEVPE